VGPLCLRTRRAGGGRGFGNADAAGAGDPERTRRHPGPDRPDDEHFGTDAYAFILVGATLGDLYGRKRCMLLGTGGMVLAAVLCTVVPGANALLAVVFLSASPISLG
jgi:hypothetical protein